MPIKIDFVSNVRDFTRGATDVEGKLDDVADSLDDVARGGDTSLGRLDRSFRDLADNVKDTERAADRAGHAIDDMGDGGARSFGRVAEGADELSSEISGNLGEAVSSFRGDMGDLGQIGQDTLGGLAATIGGTGPAGIVGAAALAAGAAGLGLVTAELERQQKEAEALRDRLTGAYQEAMEAGNDYLSTSQIIAESNDLQFNTDRANEWARVQETAKRTGLDINTVIKANAGDLSAQKEVQAEIVTLLEDQDSYLVDARGHISDHLTPAVRGLRDYWDAKSKATEEASNKAKDAGKRQSDFLIDAANNAASATREVDKFGNELYKLPDGTEFVVDAKTGMATRSLDNFYGDADKKVESLNKKDINLSVKYRVDDSEVRSWKPPRKEGGVVKYTAPSGRQFN